MKSVNMKPFKKFLAMTLILAVANTGLSNNSNALVGLIFKSKSVKFLGAVGTVSGGTISAVSYISALNATNLGAAIAGAIWTAWGLMIGGVGLIILDDQKIADIEFLPIDPKQPALYEGFTLEQVETYNRELSQLNSIRQTIIAESNEEPNTADAEVLWKNYSVYLSEDTVKIAGKVASNFLNALR